MNPLRRLAQLRVLWDSGQRARAIRTVLENWETVITGGEDLEWLRHALRSCGLEAEAFAVRAATTRRSATPDEWEALIGSVLNSGDPWWARELLNESGPLSRTGDAYRVEVELTLGDASALISAWVHRHRDAEALDAAVGWWLRAGRVEEAERLAEEAGMILWLARFALWRNQPGVARPLLKQLPPSPAVRCQEGIAAAQEGRLEEAEASLRSALEGEVRGEASSWLATVLRKQHRYAEAAQAAHVASNESTTFDLVARLETELATDLRENAASKWTRLRRSIGPWRATIADLEHAAAVYPLGLGPRDSIGCLAAALERFGGNHTLHLTTTEEGKLTSYRLPPDPRFLGANILLVLWTRGPEAARALYRDLGPRANDHALFRIYQGELELWLGEYEEAARIFRDVLSRNRRVNWAWIGLGASALLQGDLRDAQRIWRKGLSHARPGPTLYVYRGECYRLQGELTKAREDLELAVRERPGRLSAWINLALLDRDPQALERVEKQCASFAPLLMDELRGSPSERLISVLEAMRGNRRSSAAHISYHLWGRLWRGAQVGSP